MAARQVGSCQLTGRTECRKFVAIELALLLVDSTEGSMIGCSDCVVRICVVVWRDVLPSYVGGHLDFIVHDHTCIIFCVTEFS